MAKVGTVGLLNEVVFRAYGDVLNKRRKKTKVDNAFMQEAKRIHANTALSDMDGDFKRDVNDIAMGLLGYITAMGFTLVPKVD